MSALTPAAAAALVGQRFGVEGAVEDRLLTVRLPRDRWQDFARFAKTDLRCLYFNWLSAVDWKEQGFEVMCRVEDLDSGLAVMMRTALPAGETACPSLTGVYRGADWMERECWDMFGIRFEGHPDPRRILLGQDWEGHPLRKDYAVDMPQAPYR
ncbi:MAG: NADH-quinone oxidoreductase subunit C [Candidatus Rokuibacteriota bacterium]